MDVVGELDPVDGDAVVRFDLYRPTVVGEASHRAARARVGDQSLRHVVAVLAEVDGNPICGHRAASPRCRRRLGPSESKPPPVIPQARRSPLAATGAYSTLLVATCGGALNGRRCPAR